MSTNPLLAVLKAKEPKPEPTAPEPEPPTTKTTTTKPATKTDQAKALEALQTLLAGLSPQSAPGLTEAQVVALIQAHSSAPREYTFTVPEAKAITLTGHACLPLVTRLVQLQIPTMIWSGAGTSKTTLAHLVSQALGVDFYSDSYTRGIGRAEILGYKDVHGNSVSTQLAKAYTNGGLYLADEGDADGVGIVAMNRALANGQAVLAGEAVKKHENFRFMLAANTPGTGQANGYRREPLDAAFLDRLFVMHMKPDPQLEWAAAGLSGKAPTRLPPDEYLLTRGEVVTPEQWGKIVFAFRNAAEQLKIGTPLSSSGRATWLGAKASRADIGVYWLLQGLIRKGRPMDIWKTWVNRVNSNGSVHVSDDMLGDEEG